MAALPLYQMLSGLGDTLGGAMREYGQRQSLAEIGKLYQAGDVKGAAAKAFEMGDVNTGVQLLTSAQQREADAAWDARLGGMSGGVTTSGPATSGPATTAPMSGSGPFNVNKAYELIKRAGGSDEEARVLAAIAQPESSGNPMAHNSVGKDDSYGLWQINMRGGLGPERLRKLGLSSYADLYDPETNAKAALALARERGGYGDWSTYQSGAYKRFLPNGQPVQVADASGGVPASVGAGVSGGDDIAALEQQRTVLESALADSRISPAKRAGIQAMIAGIDRRISRNAPPAAVKEYELARREGFTGSFMDFRKAGAPSTTVNIDQKGASEFEKETGKGLAKRFQDLSDEGASARNDMALLSELRDLGNQIGTGGGAALQGWLANYGIKVGENVGAVEAYGKIIDKLTPQQRIPGSGATSDYDARMFRNSLPSLITTPEGNSIVQSTLAALAQSKIERATIAERAQVGEISYKDAVKQLRELPSPYEAFKNFRKGEFAPPAQGGKQQSQGTLKPLPPSEASLMREAIANGADPAKVIERARSRNFDTSGFK